MQKAAAVYFGIVFGAGFLLGPLRVLWLEPRVGTRWAELFEMPLMLGVIVLAARWVNQRFPGNRGTRLRLGLLACALLLTAEVTLGIGLSGRTPLAVLFDRDPVSGSAYYAALAVFTLLPWWLSRR